VWHLADAGDVRAAVRYSYIVRECRSNDESSERSSAVASFGHRPGGRGAGNPGCTHRLGRRPRALGVAVYGNNLLDNQYVNIAGYLWGPP
jgi:hypothetical protein